MNGFYEALKQGDDQFFKTAGVAVRFNSEEIIGVPQPYEESYTPSQGGLAKTGQMMVDVKNEDLDRLSMRSGKKIDVMNLSGEWVTWLIDVIKPSAWTTTLTLIPSSGAGSAPEF